MSDRPYSPAGPGTRAPTLREVAAAMDLDASTVSRALRPSTQHMVRPETLRRVLATAEAMGYRVNPFARGLRNQQSMTVGILLPDLANPLFPPIVRGIEDELRKHNYALVIANTDRDESRERTLVDVMVARRVDGLIMATAEREYPLLKHLRELRMPVVLVNRTIDDANVAMVSSDDHSGVGQVVRHLAELGHRRIGYVGGPQHVSTGFHRYHHFVAWMQALQVPTDPSRAVFAEWFTKDDGYEACTRLLAQSPDVTAIVTGNDLLALGCYRALRETGRRVPEDVSVVGYNGSRWCDEFNPPLTSVHVPKYDIGRSVAAMVLERIEDHATPARSVLVPTTLQVRESTAAPAAAR